LVNVERARGIEKRRREKKGETGTPVNRQGRVRRVFRMTGGGAAKLDRIRGGWVGPVKIVSKKSQEA